MKLTGKLKTQVDNAPTKEEKRDAIKQAGMLLTDDELDQVAGGSWLKGSCNCMDPQPSLADPSVCRNCKGSLRR